MQDLGTMSGYENGIYSATAINDGGVIVGKVRRGGSVALSAPPSSTKGFIKYADQPMELLMPGNPTDYSPTDINFHGDVVGNGSYMGSGSRPFLKKSGEEVVWLGSVYPTLSSNASCLQALMMTGQVVGGGDRTRRLPGRGAFSTIPYGWLITALGQPCRLGFSWFPKAINNQGQIAGSGAAYGSHAFLKEPGAGLRKFGNSGGVAI